MHALVPVKPAIELAARAGKDTVLSWELIVSPTGRALTLEKIASDPNRTKVLFRLERR